MFESYIMPKLYRPNLLHILCDDIEYEKQIFLHLDHQSSRVSQSNTKTKQTTSNESNETSSCSSITSTHYAGIHLILLGDYKAFFENNNESTPFPTYPHPLTPTVCRTFC